MVALDSLDLAASNGLNGTSRNSYDPVTMKAWFKLLAEKNQLIRQEQELLVQAKLLELEDNSAKMEVELRSHLSGDTPTNTGMHHLDCHREGKGLSRKRLFLISRRDSIFCSSFVYPRLL